MILFRNEKILKFFFSLNLEKEVVYSLVENIKDHWNE